MVSLMKFLGWCASIFFVGIITACSFVQDEEILSIKSETAKDRMARAIFLRHMLPINRWLDGTGVEPIDIEHERYYALLIEPEEPGRAPLVCIRFSLNYKDKHIPDHTYTEAEPWWSSEEGPLQYAVREIWSVRESLRERMELAFVYELDGPMETFSLGAPVFIRMPTQDSDPKKYKKEDVIYRN
jgi:hypothetical protein